jgi:hypothetical protein
MEIDKLESTPNKYSYEWCDALMKSRGYESTGSYMSYKWSKLIGDMQDEDSFWIFAHIRTDQYQEGIQLSSNILKYLISIQTTYIQVDHPEFEHFEKKLVNYIDSCLQHDYVQETIRQRRLERESNNKK